MPFPRAKANAYEYGIHVPLAVRWGAIKFSEAVPWMILSASWT